jgi:uncharacterized protein YacL
LTQLPGGTTLTNLAIGAASGLAFGLAVISTETLFKKFNLKTFNTAALGLLFGCLMGEVVFVIFENVLSLTAGALDKETVSLMKIAIFLFSGYVGMILTARAADEFYVSIPFVQFKQNSQKKRDLILDSSILMDPRIIDLASSGLLDNLIILPKFMVKEFQTQLETGDDAVKAKAKKCLEVIKKLEGIQNLDLKYNETDVSDIKDTNGKLLKLARLLDASLLTADINRIQQAQIEGIRIINIHLLSNALKPIAQSGESIDIKVLRYGKEPRQGVGYLEDGTMVVINGGADFIGQTVRAQVISVKHTPSGRLIFCNSPDEEMRQSYESFESPKHLFMQENNY